MYYRRGLLDKTKEEILEFISSIEEDKYFVEEVVDVFKAYVKYLANKGIVKDINLEEVLVYLDEFKHKFKDYIHGCEDIFESLEIYLTSKLGDRAKYLFIGRSRNDHVATALRLHTYRKVSDILKLLEELEIVMNDKIKEFEGVLMPTYTHEREAQISCFSHYLGYIIEIIRTHRKILALVNEVINCKSPLGSAGSAGTLLRPNKLELAYLIGLKDYIPNALYATSTRDFIHITLALLASLMTELSRVATDLIRFSSSSLGFVELPKEHLSTSSLMPHKKNPVTLEVFRALAMELTAYLVASLGIAKGIPSGYNLDLQEINKYLFISLRRCYEALNILKDLISKLKINKEALRKFLKNNPYLLITDIVEYISLKLGLPFRLVHNLAASVIRSGISSTKDFIMKICDTLRGIVKNEDVLNKVMSEINYLVENPEVFVKLRCSE